MIRKQNVGHCDCLQFEYGFDPKHDVWPSKLHPDHLLQSELTCVQLEPYPETVLEQTTSFLIPIFGVQGGGTQLTTAEQELDTVV